MGAVKNFYHDQICAAGEELLDPDPGLLFRASAERERISIAIALSDELELLSYGIEGIRHTVMNMNDGSEMRILDYLEHMQQHLAVATARAARLTHGDLA